MKNTSQMTCHAVKKIFHDLKAKSSCLTCFILKFLWWEYLMLICWGCQGKGKILLTSAKVMLRSCEGKLWNCMIILTFFLPTWTDLNLAGCIYLLQGTSSICLLIFNFRNHPFCKGSDKNSAFYIGFSIRF